MDELVKFTSSITQDHLGLAVDLLHQSYKCSSYWRYSHRQALSSVLHVFLALEAAVNLIGDRIFFDPDSPAYVSEKDRDFPMQLMIRGWKFRLSVLDKINFFCFRFKFSLPAKLENELRELDTMRNWIVHGTPYKTTILFEEYMPEMFQIADREDNIDWSKTFPNTKLKSPAHIDYTDARTANRIVLDMLKILSVNTGERFIIYSLHDGEEEEDIDINFNIEDFLVQQERAA